MGIIRNGQALFALFLLILNTGYLVEALRSLPIPFAYGEPGPAFLPLVLAAILYLAAGRILHNELRGTEDADVEGEAVEDGFTLKPILIILVTAIYIWLFESFGYWFSTMLYTLIITAMFEYEKKPTILRLLTMSVAVAIPVTVSGWLFFVTLFKLILPTGSW